MKVLYDEEFENYNGPATALALGTFDGVHRGHQKVINKAKELAENNNLASGVFSFNPHPRRVLNSAEGPRVICSHRQKEEILRRLELEYYFCQKFTSDFSRTQFEEFVANILVKKLKSQYLVIGEDFTFGYKGEGNSEDLKQLGEDIGFNVKVLSPLTTDNNKKISSTRIRKLIAAGKVREIPELLGRYYTMAGKVVHGSGRGHELGYPTANLKLEADYILPRSGVYAGYANYKGGKYKAAANFGYNPTFSEQDYRIEVYIINLDKDIYGERVSISPVEFIREEEKFDNISELKKTIQSDILYTKNVL